MNSAATDLSPPEYKPLKFAFSILFVIHFGLVSIIYLGNWNRPTLHESIVEYCHPYVIGLNFYTEMVSMDLNRANVSTLRYRLLVDLGKGGEPALVSNALGTQREQEKNLLRVIVSMVESNNLEGATELLHSIALHAENVEKSEVKRIWIEKQTESDGAWGTIYLANRISLENGEFALLPVIELQKSVRPVPNKTNKK